MIKKHLNKLPIYIGFIFILFFGFSIFLKSQSRADNFKATVHFLDVGQGDATLIQVNHETQILIDAGPSKAVIGEVGRLMPFDDKKIEHVFISHAHSDHFMGLIYLIDRYEIGKIYFSKYINEAPDFEYLLELVKQKNIKLIVLERGNKLSLGEFGFRVLWPPNETFSITDLNDVSLIFYLEHFNTKLLFTGDAPTEVFDQIKTDLEPVDILKVSHHGSKNNTSKEMVEKLKPAYAVIQSGAENRFGHPHSSVLSILQKSTILRNDSLGTISFFLNSSGIFLQ